MSSRFLFVAALFGAACTSAPPAQPTAAPTERAAPAKGLDAMLTGYVYPYPVERFETQAQGQKIEMAYMDVRPVGEPRGVVVLFHGKNFSGAYWEETIRALVADGHRVIVPDQVGFGRSSKPTEFAYSFVQLCELTHALLAQLGVQRLSAVGHSMGGMVASRYALMYPEQVERLALVNPIGLEDWRAAGVPDQPLEVWEQAERKRTAQSIKEYMSKAYFAGQWRAEYDPLLTIQVGWAEGPDRELMGHTSALTSQMVFTQPVVQDFPQIKAPTLLIIGQRDRTAIGKAWASEEVAGKLGDYPALGRAARDAIPGAELVELDGVGHVPQVEAFDLYINALRGFLARP
jgi:pimeloyl-ACP methyl ester carboxylesterase